MNEALISNSILVKENRSQPKKEVMFHSPLIHYLQGGRRLVCKRH